MSSRVPGPGEGFALSVADQRHYTPDNFARNLKALLGAHGLTGKQAGQLTGVSPNAISGWLTGQREPSLSSMHKLAEFFEVDPFKLLGQFTGSFLMEEVSDIERWDRVEAKVPGSGKSDVVPIKKKRKS
jgi:transcriptional regulator with XRE-family HTH domain